MSAAGKGTLWLVPNLIAPMAPEMALPAAALERIRALRDYVVEGEKSAWKLLAAVMTREELASVNMAVLDEHTPATALPDLLAPALQGRDLGLLSEAGMPCVADPGAPLVALAHDEGIRVVPLSGPSSIVLALAASGLNGQRFEFLGYLPSGRDGRRAALADIDRLCRHDGATRIIIETPYRNDHLLDDCLEVLSPTTRLCVARSIGSAEESIRSALVGAWRASREAQGKVPAIFLVGGHPARQDLPRLDPTRTVNHHHPTRDRHTRKQ